MYKVRSIIIFYLILLSIHFSASCVPQPPSITELDEIPSCGKLMQPPYTTKYCIPINPWNLITVHFISHILPESLQSSLSDELNRKQQSSFITRPIDLRARDSLYRYELYVPDLHLISSYVGRKSDLSSTAAQPILNISSTQGGQLDRSNTPAETQYLHKYLRTALNLQARESPQRSMTHAIRLLKLYIYSLYNTLCAHLSDLHPEYCDVACVTELTAKCTEYYILMRDGSF
jgi:hypothetical protein